MRGENFAHDFERGLHGFTAGLAIAHQRGLDLGNARVAAAQAAHEDAVTVENLAVVGRALAQHRQELATLRALRQRDQAMARGLGVSLQQLRRGAPALRTENEELRRALHAARQVKRR